ncbi:Secreted protein [Phytophthora palmivora]|uniref:Secreted protein n=1 Tax=Phytophthora palmivora TaxID=4796 RepID=A0A2P4YUY3_9STRA|nr:Secreted protein [Phytophthora palmivora]
MTRSQSRNFRSASPHENSDVSSAVLVVDAVDSERGRNLGITVKRELYVYNHQISPENYRHSPGIHQQSQAGASNVYQYIRDNSNHQVNMTDSSTLKKSTWKYGVIEVTSGSMRAMLGIFPGMLQMDCTYKTNKYNYQLLTIVATYPFGQVQPVQYSLIGTTTDMHEVDVTKQKQSEARVLCYHFHAIKWLHETIRKSKRYGLYPVDILNQTKHIITNMNVERTQDSYEMQRVEFESLSCRDDQRILQKERRRLPRGGVMAYCVDLPHFTNHVEMFCSNVKQHVKACFTMLDSLELCISYSGRKRWNITLKWGSQGHCVTPPILKK